MTRADALLHADALRLMRAEIAAAGGNEVFFVGRPGGGFTVAEAEVLARGHASAVPAVMRAVRAGEVVIHNHPSGDLTPSEPDLAIAGQGGALGIAFVIVDNPVERAYVVVEPMAPTERREVDAAEVERYLGPDGVVARSMPGFEHRMPQVAMAREVARAFNQDGLLLVEAGTGTGKSLAYLLPAVLFALANRERVVVSTNTINLQEQLIHKDLPFLREHLGIEFKSVLLKGRSNYLCLRKAEFARAERDRLFDPPGREALGSVLDWASRTADGSRSDLGFPVPEEVWEEVASDGDDCMRVRSPFFGRCFFFNSRRQAGAADVIVVNHHLLMADLATRALTGDYTSTAVLPPYRRVIVDEAHNLEDVASSYFGAAVTGLGLLKTLGRLQPERDQGRGLLLSLADLLEGDGVVDEALGELHSRRRELGEAVRDRFARIAEAVLGYLGVEELAAEDLKVRLTPAVRSHPAFAEGVAVECRALTKELGSYASLLGRVARATARRAGESDHLASAAMRLEAVRLRLESAAETLADFPEEPPEDDGTCRWAEVRKLRSGEPSVRLASAPLEVAELLRSRVHGRMGTVVLTSATLTVGGSFDHFRRRLGLEGLGERAVSARFASPFDFATQALVLVPTDMPEPQAPEFPASVREAVADAVERSRGRAFLLFTSYSLLSRTHRALADRLERKGLTCLRQGTLPRDQLLARFRREPGAVLFAVDSFWEGVDVPGEALSLVVLVRLPFRVPTEPLQAARVEAIERRGGDPFLEYSVPQAVIKFRQGFGRLIRTRRDRGVVLILDPRVTTKRYGRLFLDSLPEARLVVAPRQRVMAAMEAFLAAAPPPG